jgi:hypothetical protein
MEPRPALPDFSIIVVGCFCRSAVGGHRRALASARTLA